ncbi:hypothetical protein ACJMK2_012696 [Sinanodonta woodiana]|uniref:G-protein coupled receptors family 1 profile domain-containing protein n=1 Tax=Sinanodonta woodiana TaxID=1069815 RepID=A0ABD3VC27_SINWO
MNNNTSNKEMKDLDFLMQNLNNEKVIENIGGIVFICLVMIVGIPGNTVTLYVYLKKYKPSTHRTFIVCLAIVDLATCSVTAPFFIMVLRYPITFPDGGICKLFHFVAYALCVGSIFILITIAIDRYHKICIPHGMQFSEKMSQYICMLDLVLACCFSWPAIVMYGNKNFRDASNRTSGTECTVTDNFVDTNYPTYFNFVLLFVVIASFISLTVIYIVIGRKILRMKSRWSKRNQLPNKFLDQSVRTETTEFSWSKHLGGFDTSQTTKEESGVMSFTMYTDNKGDVYDGSINTKSRSAKQTIHKEKRRKKRQKTIAITRTLCIITVVFVCSFLPHLALRLTSFLNKNFLKNLPFSGIAAYQTFRWTFFINSMANPIIYGFRDRKFSREVKQTIWVFLQKIRQ